MIELIERYYKEHKIISIYNDKEDTYRHLTGYIGAYNDNEMLIQHISSRGLYDGYIIIHRDTIFQLDCGGKYENKIEILYRVKKQTHEKIEVEDNAILYSTLKYAQKNNYIICAELQDSIIRGFVKEYGEETICIDAITEFADKDGISEIKLDEIIILSVDTEDEQDLLLLKQNS